MGGLTVNYQQRDWMKEENISISCCRGVCTWWARDWSKIKPHHGWWHKSWIFYSHSRHTAALSPWASSVTKAPVLSHSTGTLDHLLSPNKLCLYRGKLFKSTNHSLLVSCDTSAYYALEFTIFKQNKLCQYCKNRVLTLSFHILWHHPSVGTTACINTMGLSLFRVLILVKETVITPYWVTCSWNEDNRVEEKKWRWLKSVFTLFKGGGKMSFNRWYTSIMLSPRVWVKWRKMCALKSLHIKKCVIFHTDKSKWENNPQEYNIRF